MRSHHTHHCEVALGAFALGALMLAVSLAWSVPTARAAGGAADAQATELVRLINGERAYLGKAPLGADTFLASKARDGAVACPNDASLVMAGRAKDFAVYGFPSNSHLLRLCPTYSSMDAMKTWGYNGARGEVTALNGGYGTTKVAYAYGCTPSVRTCPGSSTSTYYTTARVLTNWTSSSSHYSIIVGSYDRIGCGAWIGSNGAYYYDCMVSLGGRVAPKATPTPRPTAGSTTAATHRPAATQRPVSTPVAVSSTPTPDASGSAPISDATPVGAAGLDPGASPTAIVEGAQLANPSPASNPAFLGNIEKGGSQNDPPGGARVGLPISSSNLGLAAGAMATILSVFYGLLLALRRRRQRSQLAG